MTLSEALELLKEYGIDEERRGFRVEFKIPEYRHESYVVVRLLPTRMDYTSAFDTRLSAEYKNIDSNLRVIGVNLNRDCSRQRPLRSVASRIGRPRLTLLLTRIGG